MTVSNLTDVKILSPNGYFPRSYSISKITIHHMAGDLTVEGCGSVFSTVARQASSNYGIGSDGRIGCYVEEENAAWTSSSYSNDNQAITIEVADYDTYNWSPSNAAYKSTILLCADICNRYGIYPTYDGTPNASFTEHMMFAPTSCPGPWWHDRMYQVVEDVRKAMKGDVAMVLSNDDLRAIAVAVWSYWNKDVETRGDAYQILRDAATYGSWNYTNKELEGNKDTYQILRDIRDTVKSQDKDIAKIKTALKIK